VEKKLFIKQADVYGAYLAYTDHEIGRVIQAVEDLGQLDNTLIITSAATMVRARKACSRAHRMSSLLSTASRCR
jgi:membrane-anchored protein YejM (alkaline phosphatase superfamily)